ncbi:hypothetical protein GCM10022222_36490 [Amycolatopsis ultiminotia]|uniref:Uncharacterized protein n=1 Tax=Amycolatopsis ultiminotia TaxID=543629 RepID=A0ABP6WDS6_9PSEU
MGAVIAARLRAVGSATAALVIVDVAAPCGGGLAVVGLVVAGLRIVVARWLFVVVCWLPGAEVCPEG